MTTHILLSITGDRLTDGTEIEHVYTLYPSERIPENAKYVGEHKRKERHKPNLFSKQRKKTLYTTLFYELDINTKEALVIMQKHEYDIRERAFVFKMIP